MGRTIAKWLGGLVGVLVLAGAGLYGLAWWKSEQAMARRYTVDDAPLPPAPADAAARGAHLYTVLSCVECHGPGAVGQLVFDGGPVGRYAAPNLSPGRLPAAYDDAALAVAIRHGVRYDGRALRIMPAGDYRDLSDADTVALIAYLRSLPASSNDPGGIQVGPLGRVLYLFDKIHLLPAEHIDHRPRQRSAPVARADADYGRYLAQTCTGCHGNDWAGQHVPGTPPEFPDAANLTPHADGLGSWSQEDFRRALRTGKRPDGRELDAFMPWRSFSQMSDTEIDALWAHLHGLPALPSKR